MKETVAHARPPMPKVNLSGAFIRRTNLRGAILRGANLARADMSHADLRDVDFEGANLDGTILIGADLRGARNLTVEQIDAAMIDRETRLPAYLDRVASKTL